MTCGYNIVIIDYAMDKVCLRDSVISQSDLPPCLICEAPSTGIHYGVLSCEACKTFFKRNSPKADAFECAEDRRCEISYKNRNSCPYCRIQKCFKMGMSKDASKTGRRTREMNNSILKIKNVNDSQSNTNDNRSNCARSNMTPKSIASSESSSESPLSREDVCVEVAEVVQPENHCYVQGTSSGDKPCIDEEMKSNGAVDPMAELVKLFEASNIDDEDDCFHNNLILMNNKPRFSSQAQQNIFCIQNYDSMQKGTSTNGYPIQCQTVSHEGGTADSGGHYKWLFDSTKVDLYERVIEKMYEKCSKCSNGINISKGLTDKEFEHIEMMELKKQIFGSMKPIPVEDYFKFYQETGLDIDGRRDMIMQLIPMIEIGLKLAIDFFRTIPGYRSLCVKDQIELYKKKQPEFSMLSCQSNFNLEHKVFSPWPGMILHSDDLVKFEGSTADSLFVLQKHLRDLNLTNQETAVVAALCIMNTDDCRLVDPSSVESSQDFLLECLFYLFDKHHPEDKTRFMRIIDWMLEMKNMCADYKKCEKIYSDIWTSIIEFPPIVHALSPFYEEH